MRRLRRDGLHSGARRPRRPQTDRAGKECESSSERGLRIGQVATRLGLNPKTIRYYEQIGLLPPPQRSPTGYRLYSEEDGERLAFIRRAKQVGFSLEEIREILSLSGTGEAPCEHVIQLLDRKIQATAEELRGVVAFYRHLVEFKQAARTLAAPGPHGTAEREGRICAMIERHRALREGPLPPGPLSGPLDRAGGLSRHSRVPRRRE